MKKYFDKNDMYMGLLGYQRESFYKKIKENDVTWIDENTFKVDNHIYKKERMLDWGEYIVTCVDFPRSHIHIANFDYQNSEYSYSNVNS